MVKEIRTISVTVGAGASTKTTATFEKDLHVTQIIATERSNQNLSNVHVQFDIDGTPIIRPSMPVAMLGNDWQNGMPLELTIKKGASFGISVTNNLSSEVTIDFALLVEE